MTCKCPSNVRLRRANSHRPSWESLSDVSVEDRRGFQSPFRCAGTGPASIHAWSAAQYLCLTISPPIPNDLLAPLPRDSRALSTALNQRPASAQPTSPIMRAAINGRPMTHGSAMTSAASSARTSPFNSRPGSALASPTTSGLPLSGCVMVVMI